MEIRVSSSLSAVGLVKAVRAILGALSQVP